VTHLWDTHAFIWAMEEAEEFLPPKARELAQRPNAGLNAISGITLWETALLVHKGRVKLSGPIEQLMTEAAASVVILPITPAIAIKAYQLGTFHGDPADRLITATAIVHGLVVVTKDEAIAACSDVNTVWR